MHSLQFEYLTHLPSLSLTYPSAHAHVYGSIVLGQVPFIIPGESQENSQTSVGENSSFSAQTGVVTGVVTVVVVSVEQVTCSLHFSDSTPVPMHSLPLHCGTGSLHDLDLNLSPPLQFLEHSDQAPHWPQLPSTLMLRTIKFCKQKTHSYSLMLVFFGLQTILS